MNSVAKRLFVIATLSTTITGVALGDFAKGPSVLESVKGFSKWKKATSSPVRLSTVLDGLCRAPSRSQIEKLRVADPHFDSYITVFVNPTGEVAMMKGSNFPVGSTIVKEKHSRLDGPVLLSTVMIKREKGFNPKCGDWEFASLDATGEKVTAQGKLKFCMNCHQDVAKKDFVFRSYVGMKKGEFRASASPNRLWKSGG